MSLVRLTSPSYLGYPSPYFLLLYLSPEWTAPFIFAGHDAKVVHRSAHLLGYEQPFNYKEVMGFKVRANSPTGQQANWHFPLLGELRHSLSYAEL